MKTVKLEYHCMGVGLLAACCGGIVCLVVWRRSLVHFRQRELVLAAYHSPMQPALWFAPEVDSISVSGNEMLAVCHGSAWPAMRFTLEACVFSAGLVSGNLQGNMLGAGGIGLF